METMINLLKKYFLSFIDGNPVTGTGYGSDQQNNVVHNGSGNANSSGSEKSNDSSPGSGNMSNKAQRNRVPPGGYSSGLW